MIQSFYFLIIGRCGSGKSATTRQLTGCQKVEVRNSPNSVTKEVRYYESTASKMDRTKVSFGILDIPGLDEIHNRKLIRHLILTEMEQRKIDFDAILYTVDCVTRDTVDNKKIFHFLNELPWSLRDTRQCLIPLLTKYDNLIFDAEDQNTKQTLEEFGRIFIENNYGQSWAHNSLYWVNTTKNIEKKMHVYNEIKQIYESQLERLLIILQKKKTKLTRNKIHEFLYQQQKYIQYKVKSMIKAQQLIMRSASCVLNYKLTIELNLQKHTENYTVVALGGTGAMGVMMTNIIKSQIGKAVLAIGSVLLAGGVLLKNMFGESSSIKGKQQEQLELKMKFDNTYLIENIYKAITANLKQYEQQIRFKIDSTILIAHLPDNFQGQFFNINRNSVTQCYLDDVLLKRNGKGDFQYHFHDEQQAKTIISTVKLRFTILVPQEQGLLQRFEQQSYNFKKELDKIY